LGASFVDNCEVCLVDCSTLIDALKNVPDRFRQEIESLPREALVWPPAEGSWSIAAVLTHLVINDVFWGQRLRQIVREHEPVVTPFTTDPLIPTGGSPTMAAHATLEQWQRDRLKLCAWLESLSPPDWQRAAFHQVYGRTTLEEQVQGLLEHDNDHMEQVVSIREAWNARRR
jgi:uncharacterized damage-inducible protein DinB